MMVSQWEDNYTKRQEYQTNKVVEGGISFLNALTTFISKKIY